MAERRGFFARALGAALGASAASEVQAQGKSLDVQGHRGARGLAPENTLPGFMRALDLDVTTLELDIGLTKDDIVVISHDPLLNPDIVRDPQGQWITDRPAIRSMTYAQLSRYDVGRIKPGTQYAQTFASQQPMDGTGMPMLDTLFEMVAQRGKTQTRFNIETKINPLLPDITASPEQMVRALLAVIAKHKLESRCSIQSFDWRTLQISQRLAPAIPTVYLTIQQGQFNNIGGLMGSNGAAPRPSPWSDGFAAQPGESLAAVIKRAGGKIWSPFWRDLTEPLVKGSQAIGIPVIPWTVNEPADMQRLIAWGVDGIITDYPNLLRS